MRLSSEQQEELRGLWRAQNELRHQYSAAVARYNLRLAEISAALGIPDGYAPDVLGDGEARLVAACERVPAW